MYANILIYKYLSFFRNTKFKLFGFMFDFLFKDSSE